MSNKVKVGKQLKDNLPNVKEIQLGFKINIGSLIKPDIIFLGELANDSNVNILIKRSGIGIVVLVEVFE